VPALVQAQIIPDPLSLKAAAHPRLTSWKQRRTKTPQPARSSPRAASLHLSLTTTSSATLRPTNSPSTPLTSQEQILIAAALCTYLHLLRLLFPLIFFIRQQAVSTLTTVPSDMFQGSGSNFKVLGFEYWADPSKPTDGFITWQVDGKPSVRLGATAMGPDQGEGGSGVGQRLVPEEPMSIVLNLGMSRASFLSLYFRLSSWTFPPSLEVPRHYCWRGSRPLFRPLSPPSFFIDFSHPELS